MPERCAICARFGPPLCDACRSALVRLHEPVCERCGSPGASARAYARRAAPERARDGGCGRNRTRFRRPGRRRLHVGCHRRRVRVRAQASGRAPGRGRDPGESGALDSSPTNSFQNDRPSRGGACRHGAHFEASSKGAATRKESHAPSGQGPPRASSGIGPGLCGEAAGEARQAPARPHARRGHALP